MIYLYLYLDCLLRGIRGTFKSPWMLGLPIGYVAIVMAAGLVAAPLGILGAIAVMIVVDLCTSSFLHFVGQAVLGSKARLPELKKSFVEYFWPVANFWFVIFLGTLALGYALASNPNADKVRVAVLLVALVLFNAVPEVIYQKRSYRSLAIIGESVKFIQEHWVEWFIPNIVVGAAVFFGLRALLAVPYGLFAFPFACGLALQVGMAFRGVLFHELETSSPFQLRMRYHGGVGLGRR